MKKILFFITLMLLIPFSVSANTINKYYIDYNIFSNGDVYVKEVIAYQGDFNGYETYVEISNHSNLFDGSEESFRYSQIYNPTGFTLISVKELDYQNNTTFNDFMMSSGVDFTKVNGASLGDSLVYTLTNESNLYKIKMFNPANDDIKVFAIEYILKDAVVVHNDVAELYLNVFGNDFEEYIKELEIRVHSSNTSIDRVWAHGPLTGNTDLVDGQAIITNEYVDKNKAMDFRVVFNKEAVLNANKKTNVEGLNSILAVEAKLANEANEQREQAKRNEEIILFVSVFLFSGYLIITIWTIINSYNKYDKELPSTFNVKYYREFPDTYGPEIVTYLYNNLIMPKTLSASIMNMIERKVIIYEQVKKDYVLSLGNKDLLITPAEDLLLDWFFTKMTTTNSLTMDQVNEYAKKHYIEFDSMFKKWKLAVKVQGESYNFFESKKIGKMALSILFQVVCAFIAMSTIELIGPIIPISVLVIAIATIIYLVSISKRTPSGNTAYLMWKGLENFIADFGQFSERDLPHVELWGKYLVYALVFGKADKLSKTMKIKFAEMGHSNNNVNSLYSLNRFNNLMIMNNVISSGVDRAYQQSMSRIASSRASSSGGFGGGFSSGGGFGGGGHGGGGF